MMNEPTLVRGFVEVVALQFELGVDRAALLVLELEFLAQALDLF
jgi:hypothetical protein